MSSLMMSGASLLASTSGLLSLMLARVLAPGFHARQDTKTPVRYGIHSMIANMIFNFIFIFLTPLGYVGLALSTALSGTVNAISLFQGLYRRHVYRPGRGTLFFMLRLSAATLAMYLLLWWLSLPLEVWVRWSMWRSGLELGKLVCLGGLCYLGCAALLGIRPRDLKTVNEG